MIFVFIFQKNILLLNCDDKYNKIYTWRIFMKSIYTLFLSACLFSALQATPYDPLDEAEQTIYELAQEQNRLNAIIADLTYQLQEAQQIVYGLEQQATTGAYANNDLYNVNITLENEILRLNDIVTQMNNEIARLQLEHAATGYSADCAVDGLAHELDTVTTKYNDLCTQYNSLYRDYENLKSRTQNLKRDKEEQLDELSKAKRDIEDLESIVHIKNRHLKNGGIETAEYDNLYRNNKKLDQKVRNFIEREKVLEANAVQNLGTGLFLGGIVGLICGVFLGVASS